MYKCEQQQNQQINKQINTQQQNQQNNIQINTQQQNQQNNIQINTQQQNQQINKQISLIAQHSATKTIKTQILPPFSLLIASEGGGKKENNNLLVHSSSNFDEKLKIKPFGNNRTLQGICEDRITVCWWTQERCFAPSIFQIMRTLCPKTCHFC